MSKSARNFLFVLPLLLSAATVLFVFTPRRSETLGPVSVAPSGEMLTALAVPTPSQEPAAKATAVYDIANPYRALSLESGSTPLRMVRLAEPARPTPTLEVASDAPATAPDESTATPDEPTAYRPRTRVIRMLVTAYCPCRKCCGHHADGKTASGESIYANGGMFVAADTRLLPFDTQISIPGYYDGKPVPVLDRGGRIKGRRIDVFYYTHWVAKQWGARWVDVTVYLDPPTPPAQP